MGFYTNNTDKKSGDGLAITEWNDLSNAVAGNSGLTLAINPADKVGIGTNEPAAKLEVRGDLKVSNNGEVANVFVGDVGHGAVWAGFGHKDAISTTGYGLLQSSDGKCTLINKKSDGGFIGFRIDNADKMILFDNGNVGIGIANTNIPSTKLEVSGDVKATKFIGDGSQQTNLSVGATGLNLATKSGSKVGIGTDSPGQKLVVEGLFNQGKHNENNLLYSGTLAIKSNVPQIDFIDSNHKDWAIHVNEDKMYFIREPWEYKNLVLDGAGKVGIGTASPSAKLEVDGDLKVSGQIEGKIWYSREYVWDQNVSKAPVKMGPVATTVAFLTCVRGEFEGYGEMVEIVKGNDGYWYLQGKSNKDNVMAKARCIGKPY